METNLGRRRRVRLALLALVGCAWLATADALAQTTAEDHLAVSQETKLEIQAERRMLCFGIGCLLWLCVVHRVSF